MKFIQVNMVLHKKFCPFLCWVETFFPVNCKFYFSLKCGHGLYLTISIKEQETRPCIAHTGLVLKNDCAGNLETLQKVCLRTQLPSSSLWIWEDDSPGAWLC